MKITLAIFLFINSLIHFAGFIVFWRNKERNIHQRYRRVFLGQDTSFEKTGFRIIAILFFLTALAFFFFGVELLTGIDLFWNNIWRVTILSIIFCIVGWPRAKFGLVANVILILFLILNNYHSWVG